MRRGRMFYFRKRLPADISKFGSKPIYLSFIANPPPPRRREACRQAAHGLREKELDCPSSGFWDQWRPKLRESLAHLVA